MDVTPVQPPPKIGAATELVFKQELSEVQLLLDFISGRPDLSLAALPGVPAGPQPAGGDAAAQQSSGSDEIIDRVSRMRFPPEGSVSDQANDARFLLRARDQLNNLAYPARGKSIAFTSLVTSPDQEGSRASLAAIAYPELVTQARRLRNWMWALIGAMVVMGFLTVWLSGELAAGKLLLDRIDTIKRNESALVAQIEKVEPPTPSEPGQHTVRYCDRTLVLGTVPTSENGSQKQVQTGVQQFDSATQYHLCDDLKTSWNLLSGAYMHLKQWLWRLHPVAWVLALPTGENAPELPPGTTPKYGDIQPWTLEGGAAVLLGTLSGYALPVLYAFLGAGVAAVRNYYSRMAASLLVPRDLVLSWVRISLGLVTGALIGLIASPGSTSGTGTNGLATGVVLSGAALAFLAGYGVEQVFSFFDEMLVRIFRPTSPEQDAARRAVTMPVPMQPIS